MSWAARDYEITEAARMVARAVGADPARLIEIAIRPQEVVVRHRVSDDLGEYRIVETTAEWKWVP